MESEDELINRIQPKYMNCGNCMAYIDGDCRIDPPVVKWDHEDQQFATLWPQPEPHNVCLQHIAQHNA